MLLSSLSQVPRPATAWASPPPALGSGPSELAPSTSGDGFRPSCCEPEPVPGQPEPLWGARGHEIVNAEAASALPDSLPPFFREAADRLAALAAHPDRLKFRSLRHLTGNGSVDHYMNSELLQGHEAPRDRYNYAILIKQLEPDGNKPQKAGTLPYKIAEMFENLVAEFALYRRELARSGPDSPLVRQFQENAIYTAGMLGHFVGDATQPLHATVHHDGWDESREANPEGFRTDPGIHSLFETRLVNQAVDPHAVAERIPAAELWEGDPLDWGLQLVDESQGYVREVYRLEKNGELSPSRPSQAALDLVTGRLARGAQVLRDLWHTAWERSADLASGQDDADGQDLGYLLARG